MQFKDYYEVLGVKPDASADEIKSVYRKLARKFHPDVSKEKNAEERFKDINEAFEALKEPERRAAYDQARANGFRAGDEFRPSGGHGGFDFGDAGNGQFSDFFESLFGRMRGGPGGAGTSGGRRARAEGSVGFGVVRQVVAADVHGLALDGDEFLDDLRFARGELLGDGGEDGFHFGVAGLRGDIA